MVLKFHGLTRFVYSGTNISDAGFTIAITLKCDLDRREYAGGIRSVK